MAIKICTNGHVRAREADLGEADLTGADLRRANLTGADLTGVDLDEADLHVEGRTTMINRRGDL